jgi:hypothetical protein
MSFEIPLQNNGLDHIALAVLQEDLLKKQSVCTSNVFTPLCISVACESCGHSREEESVKLLLLI